ncbi:MAG: methylenetetrahydrofolate reductase [Cardiobacteriaceae bacterium]|nr:methylenetetrahydrofolate reductase [Cardiobacteriaceae bacterium]
MTTHTIKEDIQTLLSGWSIELTPRLAAQLGDIRSHLPENTKVYVTFLPGSDFRKTFDTCRTLRAQGMTPVPHIALRNFPAKLPVRDALQQLIDHHITDILLIAGGGKGARNAPQNVAEILETPWFPELPFSSVGFAAHPEGNPLIKDTALRDAERIKHAYAQNHPGDYYYITQFAFRPEPLLQWMDTLRQHGTALPVHIGIPGLASRKSLLRHARHCGVGASAQYLRRNLLNWRHFFSPRQPDNILHALATRGNTLARRLHFYPLGALAATLQWIRAIENGHITLTPQGFRTHA